jgi:hypothetical protein
VYDDVQIEELVTPACPDRTLCNGDFAYGLAYWQHTANVSLTAGRSGQGVEVRYDGANSDLSQLLAGVFEGGRAYRVSVWCLAEVGEQCGLFLGDANRLHNPIPYEHEISRFVEGTGVWQRLTGTLTLRHADRVDVYLYSKVPGSRVIYDDVEIEEVSTYRLTVVKTGSGTGLITGSGIDCGPDCTEYYLDGTVLNLKAIPDGESRFAGWFVNGKPVSGMIPVTEEVTVTAIFETHSP